MIRHRASCTLRYRLDLAQRRIRRPIGRLPESILSGIHPRRAPMPCLLAVFALFVPRVVVAGLWLLTSWFVGVFDSILWLILGFLIAPTTLLWYSVVANWYGGEWGAVQIVVGIIALVIDFSPASEVGG